MFLIKALFLIHRLLYNDCQLVAYYVIGLTLLMSIYRSKSPEICTLCRTDVRIVLMQGQRTQRYTLVERLKRRQFTFISYIQDELECQLVLSAS